MTLADQRKDAIRRLLKSIETGDPAGIAVVDENRYIQHNPQTREGGEGLAALFARLAKSNPRVNLVRIFSDGDFVFAHTEYDFSTRRIGFEVFRFDGDRAVEHWDNIQPRLGPNPSGHSMVDGSVVVDNLQQTEENRDLISRFVCEVLVSREWGRFAEFVRDDVVQHNPLLSDGASAWHTALSTSVDGVTDVDYLKLHRVLAEGSFVLAVSEGRRAGVHSAFYDLFRVEAGHIAEHWDTVEAVAPQSEWKNKNGKF